MDHAEALSEPVRFEIILRAREAVMLGVLDTPAALEAAAEGLADALAERRAVEGWPLGDRRPH